MAYFAEIDENNIVIRVLAVRDSDTQDDNGDEVEEIGIEYLRKGFGGSWKQTSYNTRGGVHQLGGIPFRKNYAGIGYIYVGEPDNNYSIEDAFISPQPYPSWELNTESGQWEPPVPYPFEEDVDYIWDESEKSWIEWDL